MTNGNIMINDMQGEFKEDYFENSNNNNHNRSLISTNRGVNRI